MTALRVSNGQLTDRQGVTLTATKAGSSELTCRAILGALVKRKNALWTYQELADDAGVAKSTVQRYTKPKVYERMPAAGLLRLREDAGNREEDQAAYRRFVGSYYVRALETATPLGYDANGVFYYRVNTSALRHLVATGRTLGWDVSYDTPTGRVWVTPLVEGGPDAAAG